MKIDKDDFAISMQKLMRRLETLHGSMIYGCITLLVISTDADLLTTYSVFYQTMILQNQIINPVFDKESCHENYPNI